MPRLENVGDFVRASNETILEKAKEVTMKELERSTIFDALALGQIPRFSSNELSIGRVIGRGGFSVIYELNALKLKAASSHSRLQSSNHDSTPNENGSEEGRPKQKLSFRSSRKNHFGRRDSSGADDSSQDIKSREYLARRVWSKAGKYVVKQLDPVVVQNDRVSFLKGMIDLVLEMHYLASLSHLHIMEVRGICDMDPCESSGFFLILDQLKETLTKRLNTWMHKKRTTQGLTGMFTGGKRKVKSLLTERLLVAHDIAEGMDYLHSRRIVFRDLKPDNVGFNNEGTVKIFDFGLAKELQDSERDDNGLYRMTGFTGAIRYMAPEVGLYKAYNLSADVYSWSMVMWFIMALEPPMGFYTPNMFVDRVFQKGYRPAIKAKWPAELSNLMRSCWSEEILERPDFKTIMLVLRKEATALDPSLADLFAATVESGRNHSISTS